MNLTNRIRKLLLLVLTLAFIPAQATESSLPLIGDSTSAIVSMSEENRIGRAWVRTLRARASLLNDPQIYNYVDQLLQQLSPYSVLPDLDLTLVILDNETLNAFAVPGGIVGVHAGLFSYTRSEDEFASVLAHELAHLSQRHFALSLEQEQKNLPWQLAATLASVLLAVTSEGNTAPAAMAAQQAAAMQQRLAFSRQHEQEADRIGMTTLSKAGFDPSAMPQMFEQMQRSINNLGQQPPEFLLTHPVTETRIADSMNRAAQLDVPPREYKAEFSLIKVRAQILLSDTPRQLLSAYREAVKIDPNENNYYGLALSAILSSQLDEAQQAVDWLLEMDSHNISYLLLKSDLLLAAQHYPAAINNLQELQAIYPDNHPITMALASTYFAAGETSESAKLLKTHSRRYPNDLNVWYLLAEAQGLEGDILGLHQSRAEYFLLKGSVSKAVEHLKSALRLPSVNDQHRALLHQRIKDAEQIKKDMNF